MSPRVLYAALCVLGTILPYCQFIPFLDEHGLDVRLLLQQLFANSVSSFFAADVVVSALVLLVFVTIEGRRLRMRHRWLPVVALLTVGVSLALPLFLYQREEHLNRSTPEAATR